MNYLVLITARIGSKRLKFKNIKYLNGLRLFEHTLKFAIKNFDKKKILVSTDSSFILRRSKDYNVLCPWLRPLKFSLDNSSSYDTIKHAARWFEYKFGKLDYLILLQPTTPFRNNKTLRRCIKLFEEYKDFNVKTICKKYKYSNKKKILFFGNICSESGSFYIFPRKNIFSEKMYIKKNKYILVLDDRENIDIDNLKDYYIARQILR